jgi:Apea-like HEPN
VLITGEVMHPEARKALLSKTTDLINNMTDTFSRDEKIKFIQRREVAFYLIGTFVDLFQEVVEGLMAVGKDKFSEEYIDDALRDLLAKAAQEEKSEKLAEYLDNLISEVENYSLEQIVYIPLDGIEMTDETLLVGKVTLTKMTDVRIDELLKKFKTVIWSTSNTEEQKKDMLNIEGGDISNYLRGNICAEVHVVAEPNQAMKLAEEEARKVLDLFRYVIPALHHDSTKVALGLQGEGPSTVRYTTLISNDNSRAKSERKVASRLFWFNVSPDNLKHMRELGVFKVAELLKKHDEDLNPFERAILRSIHWFASSQEHKNKANRLLNLITCLETFITPESDGSIASAVSEGTAIIIVNTVEERKRLKEKVMKLYKLRSNITHGRPDPILDSELRILEWIAGSFIKIMIERMNEFSSTKELRNWLEMKRLSG